MRVLLLRQEPSARARVHAVALAAEHPEIELALARQGAPGGEGVREWQLGDRPARGLREAIAAFSPDLVHSYGPSAELTVCVHELTAGRLPVIHDLSGKQRRFRADADLEARAVEESAALVVGSQVLLDQLAAEYTLPPLTMVFPSYSPARELRPADRAMSAEANIDRLAALYQGLAREPMAGLAAELRGR